MSKHEYTRGRTVANNIPYALMVALGAIVLFRSVGNPPWHSIAAGGYLLYGIASSFWVMMFICPCCGYYGTRGCASGYGALAERFRPKGDVHLFPAMLRRHIPVITPTWLVPAIVGTVALVRGFDWTLAALLAAFALDSFLVLPLLSMRHDCGGYARKNDWREYVA